ncbi:MAG: YbjN domain-containing protein [Oscillospiraceae bacterium]|nr:YbjN domain-containing protein [Oscillospiraceae bacterium]
MANYKNLYMHYMDNQGIKYTDVRDNVVKVIYTGDNLKTIPVFVFFDKDGDPLVCFKCWEIANFKGNLMAAGIIACNELNKKYRWVKFYLDDDCDVVAQIDAYIDDETCGQECTNLVKRVVNIVDEGYPVFMRALYS